MKAPLKIKGADFLSFFGLFVFELLCSKFNFYYIEYLQV